MHRLVQKISDGLLALAALAMIATFVLIVLGILARELRWDLPGLDAYAGYAIAAALFLSLPATLLKGEHIRVSLVLDRLSSRARNAFEWWCLIAATALATYLSVFAVRLVWVSWSTHDISTAADATPLWIPQLTVAVGCIGFLLAFIALVIRRLHGERPETETRAGEAGHIE